MCVHRPFTLISITFSIYPSILSFPLASPPFQPSFPPSFADLLTDLISLTFDLNQPTLGIIHLLSPLPLPLFLLFLLPFFPSEGFSWNAQECLQCWPSSKSFYYCWSPYCQANFPRAHIYFVSSSIWTFQTSESPQIHSTIHQLESSLKTWFMSMFLPFYRWYYTQAPCR